MAMEISDYGAMSDGRETTRIDVDNGTLRAALSDYGARLVELHVPDRAGRHADVVLGYDDLGGYERDPAYLGATCGRYGNRIRGGRFTLDGVTHQLDVNEPPNQLHGGSRGFDRLVWSFAVDESSGAISFSVESPDGDQGFPGAVRATTSYRFDGPALHIEMTAVADAPTIVNLVHHSYWNLGGHDRGTVLDHLLMIDADSYTPVDDERLPTGEIRPVDATSFDFRDRRPIGAEVAYDHNWVLVGPSGIRRRAAVVADPGSGRMMTLETTEPGLQFYAGAHLPDDLVGKAGAVYGPNSGLALESQKFPDSPNHTNFPDVGLAPGDRYRHEMLFTFSND